MSTEVIVCCGVGGTGKTTTAAGVAVAHAMAGKRTVVLTIDPARRLADALGVELGNDPTLVPDPSGHLGPAAARLAATMLDREGTWNQLVREHSQSAHHAARLLENRYYQAVATRLTGSHEYMAIEKLHQLVTSGEWDLVVLDTPPAQHVLEFFEAPERIESLLDKGPVSALLRPSSGLVGMAARRALSVIERLAGKDVMAGITEFFELFGGLSEGLRARSSAVGDLLASNRTRYLLVTDAAAPERSDVLSFLDELTSRGMQFAGFLVNRTAPDATFREPMTIERLHRPDGFSDPEWAQWTSALLDLPLLAADRAGRHRERAAALSAKGQGAPVWRVPELPGGVGDLASLTELARSLPPNPTP